MINRRTFFVLGLVTLFGFGAVGVLLIEVVQGKSVISLFTDSAAFPYQLYRGLLFGLIAAGNMLWLIETPLLKAPKVYFQDLIKDARLQWPDLMFLSLAAGIGEELLFRGGIQPYLGIWLTAIGFVALHGYLNPFNWKMSVYGVLMVVVSAGLGYLFDRVGIVAAIMAHFIIDLVLFFRFRYFR